jgi:iron complex outermembrane recepter protein
MVELQVNALGFRKNLLQGICVAALAVGCVAPAVAQESQSAGTTADEEIVITGMRENLATSLSNKRNADTVIDSVSAKDIGSFPDKSVAEALQRIPGITVNRFAAPMIPRTSLPSLRA